MDSRSELPPPSPHRGHVPSDEEEEKTHLLQGGTRTDLNILFIVYRLKNVVFILTFCPYHSSSHNRMLYDDS